MSEAKLVLLETSNLRMKGSDSPQNYGAFLHAVFLALTLVFMFHSLFVGRRGSVVVCTTHKREMVGSIPGCVEYAQTLCSYR